MKQVAQRARDGRIVVVETPVPSVRDGWILVSNVCSLISAGTERSKLELGSMNLAQKARARPDLTKQVLRRARSEGVRSTMAAVRDRLDSLSPLGYSSAGIVRELGPGVEGLVPGDRVACAGGGWANHAEVVAVPKNLVAKIPAEVSFEEATYGTVGAIALHAVRQSGAVVGERIGVIGLGLVGQLAMRILRAAGCHSTGVDVDEAAVDLAATSGFAAFIRGDARLEAAILDATDGLGLDAILVCAGGRSSDPVELAAQLARDRGRVVIVGDVAVAADRRLLYEKELELRLSRSYGAGRYDREYEEGGRDLPIGYVRWTEQRNLRAFLELIATGRIEASTLTTHRFPVERAADAYAVLGEGAGTGRPFGVLLDYEPQPETVLSPDRSRRPLVRSGKARVGLVGAGSFARRVLIPALRSNGAELVAVATESGLTAADVASRFGFQRASIAEEICLDEDIDVVVIATRHSSHATLAATALRAGKAVFVEKPLALNWEQLREVDEALGPSSLLFVGFNRRFAPLTARLGDILALSPKKVIVVRVNAGALPQDHWLNDADEGGGRLIGEGCHFVDLITHLAQAPATTVHALAADPTAAPELSQSFVANLRCANGTVGSIIYAGNGDPRLAKERIEGFAGGIAAVLDDFSVLEIYDGGKKKTVKGNRDKGHRAQITAFLEAAKGHVEPPPAESYLAASRATLALADSLRIGEAIDLG
jgi:predicted dehydrogenase/threonine dehydrogenase-like Zn-dependent dehydrogenase